MGSNVTPPLPPGFELETSPSSNLPPLPAGFELEGPTPPKRTDPRPPGIPRPQVDMQPVDRLETIARGAEDALAGAVSTVVGPGTVLGNMILPVMDRIFPNEQDPGKLTRAVRRSEQETALAGRQALTSGSPVSAALAPFGSAPVVNVANAGVSGQLPAGPVRGVAQGVESFASGLTQPVNAMLGGAGAMAKAGSTMQRLMSAGFSLDMINHAMQSAPEAGKAIEDGDYETAARLITEATGSTVMAAMAGSHAIAREKSPSMAAGIKPQTPTERGTDLITRLPNDALVAVEDAFKRQTAPQGSQPVTKPNLEAVRREVQGRQQQGESIETTLSPQEIRRAGRERVTVPNEGPSIEQQRIEAARGPIAERLGVDLAKASPDDLATVDQLAREGYTGQASRIASGSQPQAPFPTGSALRSGREAVELSSSDRALSSQKQPVAGAAIPIEEEIQPSLNASPQPTAREPKTLPVYGRNTEILIPGERKKYQATYSVREAEDVIASHNSQNFETRSDYQFKNDRNYSEPQNAERIVKQTAEFDPAFVVNDNPTAENGPPIIDWNGNVLGGNSRTMTLDRVRSSNPAAIEAYKAKIAAEAKKLGLDPAAVEKMKNPVLVRQVVEDIADPQAAITDFNKVGTAELRQAERAIADSRRVTPKTLEEITKRIEDQGPDGTLTKALDGDAVDLVNRLTEDGVLTVQERPRLMNSDGRLTAEGKQRMTRLLTGRLFEDARHFEETAPELRQKVERIVAPLAKVEGVEGWDITDKAKEAIRLVEEARTRDLSIDELTSQRGMFGDRNYSAEAIAIAKKFQDKPTEVAKAFRQYAAEAELGASDQMMMGMEPPTAADSFRAAFRTVDQLKEDIKAQLGSERGSISGKRAKGPSLSQNLSELAGIYIREGIQKFSEFMGALREAFGKIPTGAAKAWNAAKKLNQEFGRGEPERGSVRIGKGQPEEEAKIRSTASGSGGRGGRTTETAAAAGAEAEPGGRSGQPSGNSGELKGGKGPTVSPSYEKTKPNILKNVAPEVAEAMKERLQDFEKRNTARTVVTFEAIQDEARSLGADVVAKLDASKLKAGETLDPAVRFAARETLNGLNQEIATRRQEMVKNAGTWDETKRLEEMRKVESMEEDAKRLIDVLIPTRSQDGRNLAYHAMMAKQSFDVTYWLSRARRARALPEGVELPADVEKGIREITGKGAAAEAAAIDRIQGDGKTTEAAARRKAEKEAKAELGPEPTGGPEAASRAERAKAAAKPDPTLAEKQARYREKLLAKIDEKMKGVEKKPRAKSKWELTPAERAEVDNDPAVKQARIELSRKMMRLDRSTFLETLTTLRRAGLLTSARTHLRNFGGNSAFQAMEETSRLPAMAVDAALATFTGERTVEGPSLRSLSKASRAAATRGVKEAGEIMRKGATDDQLAQMDMVKELNSGNKYLDAYANTIFRSMSAADRIFKTFAYERSIQEQLKLSGKTEITEAMRLRAWEDANFATFNNDNMAADLLKRGKSALAKYGEAGQVANFAIDLAVPFARTPANIVARVIDYTPVGSGARAAMAVRKALKGGEGLTPEFQRQISLAIGRGAVGSALLTLGWNLSQAGLMTGIAPESRGERDVDEAAGRMYGSFLLDGKWHRVDAFSPLGNLLTLGATLQREQDKGGASLLFAGGKTVMEQPMLSGASQVVDAVKDPARSANRFVGSVAGSFVPSAVADVASAFDDKRRDTKGDDLGSTVAGAVSNRVPGLRNTLPERRDVLGREQRQELLSIVDPTVGSEAKELSNPVLKEMVENRVVMQKPNRPKDMPVEEYQARQKLIGDVIETRLGKLIESDEYEGGSERKRSQMEKKGKLNPGEGLKQLRREMMEAEISKVRSTFTRAAKAPSWESLSDEQKKERVLRRLKQ